MPQIQSYESFTKEQLIEIILHKSQEIEDLQVTNPNLARACMTTASKPITNESEINRYVNAPRIRNVVKDAARYLWLRNTCGLVEYKNAFGAVGSGMLPSGKTLDDAIDAEMEKRE